MSNDRFVLDTNLLISAALFKRSIARQAFDVVISTGIVLLSEPVLAELNDVFSRSRSDRYLYQQQGKANDYQDALNHIKEL